VARRGYQSRLDKGPDMETTDILIVGAGPTGLTLANILGCNGINAIIIDRKASTVAEPRAVSIDDESLRTMQAIGLAPEVLRDVVGRPLLRQGRTNRQ
jgi:3-(3-hydroxy-phenyl)propionate hydroxylase